MMVFLMFYAVFPSMISADRYLENKLKYLLPCNWHWHSYWWCFSSEHLHSRCCNTANVSPPFINSPNLCSGCSIDLPPTAMSVTDGTVITLLVAANPKIQCGLRHRSAVWWTQDWPYPNDRLSWDASLPKWCRRWSGITWDSRVEYEIGKDHFWGLKDLKVGNILDNVFSLWYLFDHWKRSIPLNHSKFVLRWIYHQIDL